MQSFYQAFEICPLTNLPVMTKDPDLLGIDEYEALNRLNRKYPDIAENETRRFIILPVYGHNVRDNEFLGYVSLAEKAEEELYEKNLAESAKKAEEVVETAPAPRFRIKRGISPEPKVINIPHYQHTPKGMLFAACVLVDNTRIKMYSVTAMDVDSKLYYNTNVNGNVSSFIDRWLDNTLTVDGYEIFADFVEANDVNPALLPHLVIDSLKGMMKERYNTEELGAKINEYTFDYSIQ